MTKYKIMDLFAGCGGLAEGFLQTNLYNSIAAVEWLKPQVDTLRYRLKTKWNNETVDENVLYFDIQRERELYSGWNNDPVYGTGKGLDNIISSVGGIDIIIGGPPCQAYSIAGRVRDEDGMKNDYRNYLFEHYLNIVERYEPILFIFENVPGMLSAMPDGTLITDLISEGFREIGYEVISDIKKYALIDASNYGVPQVRERVILVGLNKQLFKHINIQNALKDFYLNILTKYKSDEVITVEEAIGDLPPCIPIFDKSLHNRKKAYITPECNISWHEPRFHNLRDMEIFRMLAEDLASGRHEYTNAEALSKLYEEKVGSYSPIHRYHVLRPNKPSTTIIAHLYKDGNRYIHYDYKQARTITPREAARLQSFPDEFEFIGSRTSAYQMIGNAVPPEFARRIGLAIVDFLQKYNVKK